MVIDRRKLLALIGLETALFGIYAGFRATTQTATSPVVAQPASIKDKSMKLLTEFRLFASYYQFYVHDSKADTSLDDFGEPGDFLHMVGSHRQGYITNGEVVCFGTDAHLNDYWAEVYLASQTPDFGQAERVIALPLQVNSGKAIITTLFSEPDPKREVVVNPGTYTLYLLAFSLGSDQFFDRRISRPESERGSEELSDAQLKAKLEFEHYKIIFVPGMQVPIGILRGTSTKRGA